jgi:hypothetical protein
MVPGRKERRVSHSTPDRSLPALSSLVLQLALGHFTHELLEFLLGKVAADATEPPRDLIANLALAKRLMPNRLGIRFDGRVFVGYHLSPPGGRDKVRNRTIQAVSAHQEQGNSSGVFAQHGRADNRHCIRSWDTVQSNRQQPDRYGHYSSLRPSGFHAKSKVAV